MPTGPQRPCRLAAHALHRSDSALGAFLRRKKAQLGAPKAITATAHKLARIICSMLRHGQTYADAGAEYSKRNIVKGRCPPPSGGQRNWATSLSRHPMKWVIPAEAGIWSRNPTILDFG